MVTPTIRRPERRRTRPRFHPQATTSIRPARRPTVTTRLRPNRGIAIHRVPHPTSIRPMARLAWIAAAVCLVACRPDTTRPAITPYPEAAGVEIRLRQPEAIRRLAEALQAEALTPARVQLRDGYLETGWLDSATGRPTTRRPLGTDVVRLRGRGAPGRPGASGLGLPPLGLH